MQTRSPNLFVSATIALSFALALVVVSRAQPAAESPAPVVASEPAVRTVPSAPTAQETTDMVSDVATAAEAKVASAEPTQSAAADPVTDSELRRLDDSSAEPADDSVESKTGKTVSIIVDLSGKHDDEADDSDAAIEELIDDEQYDTPRRDGPPFGDHTVPSGTLVREVVSIMGDTVLEGESRYEVVSILGDVRVTGKAGGEVVAVFGDAYIDGPVGGDVVSVFGSVTLGSKAVVDGEVIVLGGQLLRDSNAVVQQGFQEIHFMGDQANLDAMRLWIHECLLLGRPLAFNSELSWAWVFAGVIFAFYVLLALMFPKGVNQCVETLEERPGYSLLAVPLSALATPILVILLAITGVGLILLPFILLGIFFGTIFGKVVMSAWLGRRFTRYFGNGFFNHAATATFIGGILLLLLFTVPFLGFFIWNVFGIMGWGVVIYTLILEMRKNRPIPTDLGSVAAPGAAKTEVNDPQPPELPLTSMPRVGFWMRIAATLIDVIVVGIIGSVLFLSDWFLLLFAVYCAVLWVTKGTTIGGIVFGLKVVRLDEGPVDWSVSIVRVLAGFLSLVVAGLGFIWVAFDPEKQSWHDKIAGTIVVRTPRGGSLV